MTAWIALAVGILVLVVGNLVGTSVGRKVLAIASGLVVLLAAGSQINIYFAYYPTVGALTGSEADVSPLTGTAQRPSQRSRRRSSTGGPARRPARARS